jgi:hypothetical protein
MPGCDSDPVAFVRGNAVDDRKVIERLEGFLSGRGYAHALPSKTAQEFGFPRGDPRFQELLCRAGLPQ